MRLPPVPRRALLAATVGALYAFLVLPAPQTTLGVTWYGVVWFVMSAGLLFLRPIAYHAFTFWGILWVVYSGVRHVRAGEYVSLAWDLPLPLASLALLLTSGYMAVAARIN